MIYGYARVSTDVQSLDAQVDEYNRAQGFTLVFCALGVPSRPHGSDAIPAIDQ